MNLSISETDLATPDGRRLHVYDTGASDGTARLTVFWHHGTPNLGSPPVPLLPASRELGIRWISYDRPGYGGSTPLPGRSVSSAAADVRVIADALGIERFAALGHSGGGPHALACAALLPERMLGAVSIAGLAPYDAEGLDWFAGMNDSGRASLTAAAAGREAKARHEEETVYDPAMFTAADHSALAGDWSWFEEVVTPALANGPGGLIDDDLAYVHPWGADPKTITCPLLLLHGGQDRIAPNTHARWLADRTPTAALWLRPDEGHLSVLNSAVTALEWLIGHAKP